MHAHREHAVGLAGGHLLQRNIKSMPTGHAVAQHLNDCGTGTNTQMRGQKRVEIALAGMVTWVSDDHPIDVLFRQAGHLCGLQDHLGGQFVLQDFCACRRTLIRANRHRAIAQDGCAAHHDRSPGRVRTGEGRALRMRDVDLPGNLDAFAFPVPQHRFARERILLEFVLLDFLGSRLG